MAKMASLRLAEQTGLSGTRRGCTLREGTFVDCLRVQRGSRAGFSVRVKDRNHLGETKSAPAWAPRLYAFAWRVTYTDPNRARNGIHWEAARNTAYLRTGGGYHSGYLYSSGGKWAPNG